MSSDYLNDLNGIKTPITHAGRVVYNAQRDSVETHRRRSKRGRDGKTALYPNSDVNDENHSIQPYELCVRNKRAKLVRWAPNDTDIHVFSSANGMYSWDGNKDPGAKRATLQFAGVASNRAAYDPRNNANEEHLAVQVGGLQTMYNTSNGEIHAGQVILWDMPDQNAGKLKIPGVPKDKLLFQTVPYNSTEKGKYDQALDTALTTYDNDDGDANAARVTLKKAFADAHARLQSRVIGKALSSAKSGKPFDILLGHYGV